MIELYTGNGKGKTTAAAGLAIRAAGSGMRVVFAQFMKGNETGEICILEKLPQVTVLRCPRQFGFYPDISEEEKAQLRCSHDAILDRIAEIAQKGGCDLAVLDEITYPVAWKLVSEEKLRFLLSFGQRMELVLTGQGPADFMTDCADYITEMKAVRHPFTKGVAARKGIEY